MNDERIKNEFTQFDKKADLVSNYFLISSFLFGIIISFFYDTYFIAIGVGGLCLLAYYGTKFILPTKNTYQYVFSFVLAVFMAQYIYQMHGMIEMHFYVFIASIILISYQNWKLQLPLALTVAIHHTAFAYMQYMGNKEIYFTQDQYMPAVTFVFHIFFAVTIFFLCGYWSYIFRARTMKNIYDSIQLNNQLDSVDKNIRFAEEISNGNLNSVYEHSEGDPLGKSLMMMRDNLAFASDKDKQDKYVNIGFTKASEILRNNNDDIEILSNNIIAFLVKYLEANQGGLFIVEHDDGLEDYLELKACYAYNRKKYVDKKILTGEGLIGQCYLEKETIFMTDIPNDYISITSGLGKANPSCIVIVPLKVNDIIYGIIEIASFTNLMQYQIEFIEKLGESIATTISSTKTNEKTKKLLHESQEQSEMLRSQEEEMRQNMEELAATQEEMERNNAEIQNRMDAINASGISSVELDMKGNIISANNTFLELVRYTLDEIRGKHHSILVSDEDKDSVEYNKFWLDLRNGIAKTGEFTRVTKTGDRVHIKGVYTIIKDREGIPERVFKLAVDISDIKQLLEKNTHN